MQRIRPLRAFRYAASSAEPESGSRLYLRPETRRGEPQDLQDPLHPRTLLRGDPAAAFKHWRTSGAVVQDEHPALHLLEMQPVAALAGERPPPVRFILGMMKADSDLESLEESAPDEFLPFSPIPALVADDHQILKPLVADLVNQNPPEYEGRLRGQLLRRWRLENSSVLRKVEQALEDLPLRLLARPAMGSEVMVAIVSLAEPGLRIVPLHRGIRGVETFREDTFLTLVYGYARVHDLELPMNTPAGRAHAVERLAMLASGYHAVLWVLPGAQGKILRFRQDLGLAQMKAAPKNPTLRSLDLALLNALVLRTVLGIREPETPGHGQVFPVSSLEELVDEVDRGVFQTGFALNPPPTWEIRAVIEAAQKLPYRTLMVDPSPPAGLLFFSPGD